MAVHILTGQVIRVLYVHHNSYLSVYSLGPERLVALTTYQADLPHLPGHPQKELPCEVGIWRGQGCGVVDGMRVPPCLKVGCQFTLCSEKLPSNPGLVCRPHALLPSLWQSEGEVCLPFSEGQRDNG